MIGKIDPEYSKFIQSKSQIGRNEGFEPTFLPDCLKPFQRAMDAWSIRKGRAALYEGCGLGKTVQFLVWGQNVVEHTNLPVLALTPLGVSAQTIKEATKFGIDATRSKDGKFTGKRIVVTNYESLRHFDPSDFGGVICDESQAIKNMDAKRTAEITELMRLIRFRLLATATPAPNDYIELGTSSEALGELGYQDMITTFFKQTTSKDHLGWGRTKYRLLGHAEHGFWRWVCSWARAIRKPSDLGFDDTEYILPPLTMRQKIIEARVKKPGHLFDVPAETMQELQEERRRTMPERCEAAAELVNKTGKPALVWCHLNPEGQLLAKLIPDAVEISGSNSDDEKEEAFAAFQSGQIRVLITKGQIGALGLNFQHCAHQVYFPSDSFEKFYQGVHRSWRFGQKNEVIVDIVASEGEAGVLANLQKKWKQDEEMIDRLVNSMNDELRLEAKNQYTKPIEAPSWIKPLSASSAPTEPNDSSAKGDAAVHAVAASKPQRKKSVLRG